MLQYNYKVSQQHSYVEHDQNYWNVQSIQFLVQTWH